MQQKPVAATGDTTYQVFAYYLQDGTAALEIMVAKATGISGTQTRPLETSQLIFLVMAGLGIKVSTAGESWDTQVVAVRVRARTQTQDYLAPSLAFILLFQQLPTTSTRPGHAVLQVGGEHFAEA